MVQTRVGVRTRGRPRDNLGVQKWNSHGKNGSHPEKNKGATGSETKGVKAVGGLGGGKIVILILPTIALAKD